VTAETSSSYHQAWCAVETGRPNISRVRQRSANSKATRKNYMDNIKLT
jgi:hypothetical protein